MDRDHYISEAERQLNDPSFYKALTEDPTLEFANKVSITLTKMLQSGQISEDNFDYLQDTTDYLRKVESSPIPEETLLVYMDVTALYTNIPYNDGIAACKEAWDTRDIKDLPTETLVELLSLILKCKNFIFNEKNYLQIQGTAMGTKMAPSYANVFMGRLENQLITSVPLKPHLWLRFIDDLDMQWVHGRDNLESFLRAANEFHPTIKFTSEVSTDKHVFLDTISRVEGKKIEIDLYSKPTDKHQYLLPSSCHPKHCCKNIPYSMALRIRRICSNMEIFETTAKELSEHLHKRGYNAAAVTVAINNARIHNRDDLLNYKDKHLPTRRVPFVVTYHPDLPNINVVIDKHLPTIEKSQKLKKMFPEKPIIAYRRPKSLRDILVRAKLKPLASSSDVGNSGPCGTPRCQTCAVMVYAETFASKTGAKSGIRGVSNCKTSNAIYLMTCKICNMQYVGETKQTITKRMNLHRSDWRTRKFNRSPVAEHCNLEGHTFSDMYLCCVEYNDRWSDAHRKEREIYWIRRLDTLCLSGINKGE